MVIFPIAWVPISIVIRISVSFFSFNLKSSYGILFSTSGKLFQILAALYLKDDLYRIVLKLGCLMSIIFRFERDGLYFSINVLSDELSFSW